MCKSIKIHKYQFLIIAVIALGGAWSSPLKAETLAEALASVQVGNAKIEAERARAKGDAERIPQARAGFLPTVSATADYSRMQSKNLMTGTPGQTMPRSYGIGVSQPVFNGFRNLSDYRKAQDETLASYASLTNTEQQVMLYGAQAFMRVVRDRKILVMRRDNLHNLRIQYTQAQGRFKVGDMTLTSVDQARSRMNEAEADYAGSQADLADSEAYYRYIIGKAPGKLSVPQMSKVSLPCNLNDALIVGENENPTLQSARHIANAAGHGVNSAKSAFYPTVSLEGSVRRGYDDSRVLGAAGQDATLGVKLGVPIYSGGLDKSRVDQANLIKSQRDSEVEDTRKLVHRSVSSAWDGLKAAKLRKFASSKRVTATEAALKGLMIEYGAGQIALINVLDGRREVINAKVTLGMAENDETIAHFTLLSALGHLDMRVAQDLSQGRGYTAGGSCSHRPILGQGREFLQASNAKINEPMLAHKEPKTKLALSREGNEPVATLAEESPKQKPGAIAAIMAFANKSRVDETPVASIALAEPTSLAKAVKQTSTRKKTIQE